MDQFAEVILHWHHLAIIFVVGGGLELFKHLAPQLTARSLYRRLQRLIPLVLCSAAVWLPGVSPCHESGPRILIGLILGMTTLTGYDMLKKVLFRNTTIEKRAKAMGQELKAHYAKQK